MYLMEKLFRMVLCPICSADIHKGEGKIFPVGRGRLKFCVAAGIEPSFFDHITTERYVCFHHYPDDAFEIIDGKRKWRPDALPKKLTPKELDQLRSHPSRYNRLKNTSKSKAILKYPLH
jgi:hypothetical protein